jgi:NAD(P)-dependent dehydrogenase (short-subunit alcohol dehydrogenase family)
LVTEFPDFTLGGQVALVTGAARGLGRAIALALANAGSDLALGFRDVHAHAGLPDEIEALGRRVLPLQMNMSNLDEIHRAVDRAATHFGRLDILVNNVGIAPENLAENVTESDYDQTVNINLKGTFFASQAAGRIMIRQNRGRIINMGSQAGFAALPGRVNLLHDESRYRASDEVPGCRVGQVQHHGQRCSAHVHPHTWYARSACATGVLRGCR